MVVLVAVLAAAATEGRRGSEHGKGVREGGHSGQREKERDAVGGGRKRYRGEQRGKRKRNTRFKVLGFWPLFFF